ncbi:PepSY domain-containing protein [Pusillimonas noertemannii]|nr:PepSY domain-containing protein [Pusillimonas noertemannii]TFL12907.1 PepSY domain-containing protein [Pusillimonas noertemannii]
MHKWTSLICIFFILIVSVSGLPLIFNDEIKGWLDDHPPYAAVAPDRPMPGLDSLVDAARQRYPGHRITGVFVSSKEPKVVIDMAPLREGAAGEAPAGHWLEFDQRTGELRRESRSVAQPGTQFMTLMLRLHIDLFARLPGQLFLGLMALLFVAAVVSGTVLYGPFMRKIEFGTVRAGRSSRLRWLDLHNLLGIVTIAWALMIGATGALHELAVPLFRSWVSTDVRPATAPWNGKPAPDPMHMASVQGAYDSVKALLPGKVVESLMFPDGKYGLPHHYLLWVKGDSPLTSHLFDGVLVDVRTGLVSSVLEMPWYIRVLQVSRPLHYGDFAGLPLKIIWAIFDLITIFLLASGLYLWVSRRKAARLRPHHISRA